MKKALTILILLSLASTLFSHPWKPRHYVIIDTDGSPGDIRAITMMLASPDVRVLAILVSSSANSDIDFRRVTDLIKSFHHEGMYVGRESNNIANEIPDERHDNLSIVSRVLSYEESGVTFISLAGLELATKVVTEPEYRKKIKQVIWSGRTSNNEPGPDIDRRAAESLAGSGIPFIKVEGWAGEFYDGNVRRILDGTAGMYATYLQQDLQTGNKLVAHDEMIPVFMHYPALFIREGDYNYMPDKTKADELKTSFMKIITGQTVERNQVVKDIPVDPSFYFPDLEPHVSEIIAAYGKDEWTSGVLANELHRHLGTFAIIGVKMGIRAREYFNTGVDEFSAVSYAGSTPPLSCMNDGIQVSTGATPGHGLLRVEDRQMPVVEIKYKDRHIKISLKPDISEMISQELQKINFIYGLDSDIYWELVRKNTIKYWLDLDRHEIFVIEEL